MGERIDTSFQNRVVVRVELSMDLPHPTEDCLPMEYGATVTIGDWSKKPKNAVRIENHIESARLDVDHRQCRHMLFKDACDAIRDWLDKELAAMVKEASLDKS